MRTYRKEKYERTEIHTEQHYDIQSSPYIIRLNKSISIRWAGCVACKIVDQIAVG